MQDADLETVQDEVVAEPAAEEPPSEALEADADADMKANGEAADPADSKPAKRTDELLLLAFRYFDRSGSNANHKAVLHRLCSSSAQAVLRQCTTHCCLFVCCVFAAYAA